MNDSATSASDLLGDPDCLKCMRRKLKAVGVVIFFKDETSWRLGNYQGERPSEDAEVDFYCMLSHGAPEIISAQGPGLILSDNGSIERLLGPLKNIFAGQSLIAAPVSNGSVHGVRLAWRDGKEPFTSEELKIIACSGNCPEGCRAAPSAV